MYQRRTDAPPLRSHPLALQMREFWDERATENAFFFVDDRVDYRHPDLERFWQAGERDLDNLLNLLGVALAPSERVLEIGCGVGRLTRALARRSSSVLAVDVSARMLELARRHNPELGNVEWILGDGCTLGAIPSAAVGACISHVVFQHVPDPAITLGYIREMGRVLCPGGWAAFQISNDARVHEPLPVISRTRRAALSMVGLGPRGQGDPRWRGSMVAIDEVRTVACEAGMVVERVLGEGSQMCAVLARRGARAG